jgi:hypothetical protein
MAPQIFAFIVSYPSTSVRMEVHFRGGISAICGFADLSRPRILAVLPVLAKVAILRQSRATGTLSACFRGRQKWRKRHSASSTAST